MRVWESLQQNNKNSSNSSKRQQAKIAHVTRTFALFLFLSPLIEKWVCLSIHINQIINKFIMLQRIELDD